VLEKYRGALQALTERIFRENLGVLEFEIVGLKGTHRWLETHAVPLRDENQNITAPGKRCHPTETNRATVCQLQSHSCATGCPTNGSVMGVVAPASGTGITADHRRSPVCISYVDANQRYRFVNQTCEDWFSCTEMKFWQVCS